MESMRNQPIATIEYHLDVKKIGGAKISVINQRQKSRGGSKKQQKLVPTKK